MTSKELSYLNDVLTGEQTIIKKYQDYAGQVQDQQIVTVLNDLKAKHQKHYNQLLQQLNA